jgi:hypothetical protein
LAHGRPTVSTRLGAEGLPIRAGEHYWRADDPDAFVAALVDIAGQTEGQNGGLAERLTRAREAVRPLFWPNVVDRLIATYHAELERARPSWSSRSPTGPAGR